MKIENEAFAKFMGIEVKEWYDEIGCYHLMDGLRIYEPNKDWNQLMDVVEKINSMGIDNFGEPCFEIRPNRVTIFEGGGCIVFSEEVGKTLIKAVYKTAHRFITWYLTQSKQ